jgi:WD40 repeat protein
MVSSRNVEVSRSPLASMILSVWCSAARRSPTVLSVPRLMRSCACAGDCRQVRNGVGNNAFIQSLRMPTLHPVQSIATASLKRTFSNGHTYHINSLSFSPDGETYLSADDLRINLWNLGNTSTTFNIIDIKPDDMEVGFLASVPRGRAAGGAHGTIPRSFACSISRGPRRNSLRSSPPLSSIRPARHS